MNPKEKLEKLAQIPEDRVLLARVWERLAAGQRRNIPACSAFLSLREQELVRRLVGEKSFFFWGGYNGAERAAACYLPDYLERESLLDEGGPIACIRAEFYERDCLTHRDFLGGLMGIGIKRETVGDILVGTGTCDFFVLNEVCPYVLQNFISAGRTKLHVGQIALSEAAVTEPETVTIQDTLASLRLDSVVSAGFRIGRSLAVQHIQSGGAAIDGLPCEKPDKAVEEGMVISVRGLGKIRLRHVKGQTRKGRLAVEIEKY